MQKFYGLCAILLLAGQIIGVANASERVRLPFKEVNADVNIKFPEGTIGKFKEEDALVDSAEIIFVSPVHPTGHVNSLAIWDLDVNLIDTKIVDGMIETVNFGAIEVLSTGPSVNGIEFHATRQQIEAIEKWVEENAEPRMNPVPECKEIEIGFAIIEDGDLLREVLGLKFEDQIREIPEIWQWLALKCPGKDVAIIYLAGKERGVGSIAEVEELLVKPTGQVFDTPIFISMKSSFCKLDWNKLKYCD